MGTMSTDANRTRRVYLAGPEVFLADPIAMADRKKRICAAHGLEGVFPLDANLKLSDGAPPAELARRIGLSNEGLMRSCDLLIANCTPFRGASMDCGTAFEIGFMRALGRPVYGYSNVLADYKTRSEHLRALAPQNALDGDASDVEIEDFGLAENLMITTAMSEGGAAMITRAVEPGAELTDLAAFEACAALAKARATT